MDQMSWFENIVPIRSVTELEDFTDLEPLKKTFAKVRYIGLGESTHGTREFFQLKHRMLAFLVKEMGYRVFSIEAGSLPCQNINDYVLYGKGNRAAALASQGYWTWDTEEVTGLIEWMRQHNLTCSREQMCQFIGYDIKPVDEAFQYIRRLMPVEYLIEADLDRIQQLLGKDSLTEDEKGWLGNVILALHGTVAAHDQEIRAFVGQKGLELLLHCTEMLWQDFAGMKLQPGELVARDKFMAENILDMIHKLPIDTKVVIWAHNAHLAVDESWKNMGYRLREAFGDLYYPAALTFTRGGFQSRLILSEDNNRFEMGDLMEFQVGEPRKGFWENDLKSFSDHDFFLDFRSIKHCPSFQEWGLQQEKQLFGAGGGFIPFEDKPEDADLFGKVILGKQFDGIFHIQNTTRAQPTPTGIRIKGQKSK